MSRKARTPVIASILASAIAFSGTAGFFPQSIVGYAAGNDLYVGYSDKSNNYSSVQAAVNAAAKLNPTSESQRVTIHIAPGTYREQITIDTPYISFVNDTPSQEVLLTWYYGIGYKYYSVDSNGVYNAGNASSKSTKYEPTKRWGYAVGLRSNADYFRAENITFENSFNRYITTEEIADGVEVSGSQSITFSRVKGADVTQKSATERAAALSTEGDYYEFYNCEFLGSQDTLYAAGTYGYFKDCLIVGNTDYIFGGGTVVWDSCELQFGGYSNSAVGGYITANNGGKYLFTDCDVTANSAKTVNPGYFGRPWSATADVAFVNTNLQYESIIQPAGWYSMSDRTPENANFKEYGTTAGGKAVDTSGRTSGTVKSSASGLDTKTYLGSWTPYYLNYTSNVTIANDSSSTPAAVLDAGKLTEGTYSSEYKVNDTFSITASTDKTVTVTSKSVTAADGRSFDGVLSLGGAGNTAYRSIRINAAAPGSVAIYMASSSTDARTVNLLDANGDAVSTISNVTGTDHNLYSVNLPSAGTYYLTSAGSSVNVLYAAYTEGDAAILNAGEIAENTYSSTLRVNDSFSLTATSEKTITVTNKPVTAYDGRKFNGVISLGGAGSTSYRSLQFTTKGATTLNIYMSSSSDTDARTVNVLDSSGSIVATIENVTGQEAKLYTLGISSAGTYYLTSAANSLNIFYAELGGFSLAPVNMIIGDLCEDEVLNVFDLCLMKRHFIDNSWESNADRIKADTNGDGILDVNDVILLQDWLLAKPVSLAKPIIPEAINAGTTSASTSSSQTPTDTGTSTQPEIPSDAIYVSANGSSSGDGTKSNPYDLATAIKKVSAGGTIAVGAGTYKLSSTIKIDKSNSGSSGKLKTVTSYNGDVILDFTNQATADSNRGISLGGDYWHWYGITIQNAGDNGMIVGGCNNTIEMCKFEGNQDTGLQISNVSGDIWPANNLILNCTSCNNIDDATMENADGFAAKLTCGEGNVFDGCISYNNSDDGWDLFAKTATGPIGAVTLLNCVSFRNGYTEDGRGYGDCDGNGFKLGGSGVGSPHTCENCVAFENWHCGFVDNNNPDFKSLTNCTSYNNCLDGGSNFRMYRATTGGTYSGLITYNKNGKGDKDTFVGTIANSVYYFSSKYYKVSSKTSVSSSAVGSTTTAPADSDFVSLNVPAMGKADFHTYWRNEDGSINLQGFLEVASTSSYYGMGAVLK